MESAFGVEHGEVSKGLPSAVRAGSGGSYGRFLRTKNGYGRTIAQTPAARRAPYIKQGQGYAAERSERMVSKGVPKGLAAVAAKHTQRPGIEALNTKHLYAARRLQAHKQGKFAAAHPKLLNSDLQSGFRARLDSRMYAGDMAGKPKGPGWGSAEPRTKRVLP